MYSESKVDRVATIQYIQASYAKASVMTVVNQLIQQSVFTRRKRLRDRQAHERSREGLLSREGRECNRGLGC